MDADKLARLRYAKGYSLRALAARSGLDFHTIWAIEQGKRKAPPPGHADKARQGAQSRTRGTGATWGSE